MTQASDNTAQEYENTDNFKRVLKKSTNKAALKKVPFSTLGRKERLVATPA